MLLNTYKLMPASCYFERMFLNAFKNTFFFQKMEAYLVALTILSDDINRSQIFNFFMLFSLEK